MLHRRRFHFYPILDEDKPFQSFSVVCEHLIKENFSMKIDAFVTEERVIAVFRMASSVDLVSLSKKAVFRHVRSSPIQVHHAMRGC